jgi:hypothetical protein
MRNETPKIAGMKLELRPSVMRCADRNDAKIDFDKFTEYAMFMHP